MMDGKMLMTLRKAALLANQKLKVLLKVAQRAGLWDLKWDSWWASVNVKMICFSPMHATNKKTSKKLSSSHF